MSAPPGASNPPSLRLVRPGSANTAEPIRWSRVHTARARIAAGYYDREEVLDRLAAEVLGEIERS